MKTTVMAKAADIERKWYVVDAENQTVGRLAAEIAKVLRGKNKPIYTPHVDTGDYVIVINAEKVDRFPTRVIEHAVKGMLPKNSLGAQIFRKLNVYVGPEHPHAAQKPEPLAFDIR